MLKKERFIELLLGAAALKAKILLNILEQWALIQALWSLLIYRKDAWMQERLMSLGCLGKQKKYFYLKYVSLHIK